MTRSGDNESTRCSGCDPAAGAVRGAVIDRRDSWMNAFTKRQLAVLLIGVAVATSGCVTTLRELRQAPPDHIGRTLGDYQALAGCVTEGLQTSPGEPSKLHYETVLRPDEKRIMVTGMFAGGHAAPTLLIDLTFRQIDSTNVVIESRWGGFATGRMAAKRIDAQVWPIARRCAGGRLETFS